MSIKRFYFVFSLRGRAIHRAKTRSEGMTYCGRVVTTAWRWAKPTPGHHMLDRCKQCE